MGLKPISTIKEDLGIQPNGPVQAYFTARCYQHMDKYVPKDTGTLREAVTLRKDSITYEQEYAEQMYKGLNDYGEPVRHWTTPGTGGYWDKRMVSAEMPDIVKEVQDFIDRGGK